MVIIDAVFCLPCGHSGYWITELFIGGGRGGRGREDEISERWIDVRVER
jgi:hypothetical protein